MADHDNISVDLTRSKELLRKLQADSRKSKQDELDRLWTVLRDMQRAGVIDYTLAKVGARLERAGGLRTQSLRNRNGEDYRQLIAAFANDVSGKSTHFNQRRFPPPDWLDSISDIQLRAWARQMVEQNKVLERQVNELKSAFKALRVSEPTAQVRAPASRSEAKQPSLCASDLQVFRKSFDPARFAENGWTVSPDGAVIDDIGVTVFPPGFMEAVSKLATF
ncbi:gamma-mobile-trio protein GmtX [Caballeronia sp. DA-9]|uniref:gamma-mobile-trio protein GmtX n=1 Tax=Caballeronia sp. DA-9 TaxID=3436237 RepID=UPI003F66E11D